MDVHGCFVSIAFTSKKLSEKTSSFCIGSTWSCYDHHCCQKKKLWSCKPTHTFVPLVLLLKVSLASQSPCFTTLPPREIRRCACDFPCFPGCTATVAEQVWMIAALQKSCISWKRCMEESLLIKRCCIFVLKLASDFSHGLTCRLAETTASVLINRNLKLLWVDCMYSRTSFFWLLRFPCTAPKKTCQLGKHNIWKNSSINFCCLEVVYMTNYLTYRRVLDKLMISASAIQYIDKLCIIRMENHMWLQSQTAIAHTKNRPLTLVAETSLLCLHMSTPSALEREDRQDIIVVSMLRQAHTRSTWPQWLLQCAWTETQHYKWFHCLKWRYCLNWTDSPRWEQKGRPTRECTMAYEWCGGKKRGTTIRSQCPEGRFCSFSRSWWLPATIWTPG